jgi:hypothetical protein
VAVLKEIQLRGKRGENKVALVDDADFDELNRHSWIVNNKGYPLRTIWVNGKTKNLYMHRYILMAPNNLYVDHINGDILDNRRENLRLATHAENIRNIGMKSHNTSGYKGVSWREDKGKWMAKITYNWRQIYLGLYDSKEEAALAYNKKALELHGEFAKLNVIDNQEAK